jgi:hypothetical protein
MHKLLTFILISTILLTATSCSDDNDVTRNINPPTGTESVGKYYPLAVGHWWRYELTVNGEKNTYTSRILRKELVNGDDRFVFILRDNDRDSLHFHYDGGNLIDLRKGIFLKDSLTVADKWIEEIVHDDNYSSTYTYTVTDFFDTFKVEKKIYYNVVLVKSETRSLINDRLTEYYYLSYFAEGIGAIYEEAPESNAAAALKDFRVN